MPRALRLPLACLIGALSWAISEVGGGLAFLAAGVRLWRYQVVPLFSDITSPIVWTIAGLLIVPVMLLFDRVFRTERLSPRRRAAARLGFMMLIGPVLEVLINRHVFMTLFGEPLYLYTYLPTFQGSGSLLSPFYYATLYIHVPVADRLLGKARYERRAATPARSSVRTRRAASMSSAA
ncbi:MAG TPA: hypothetical protein VKF32_02565 [Thermoanaerobaculia bacterium]|nr:hypothetical protein [Thermoanaerobaculia bacterium]